MLKKTLVYVALISLTSFMGGLPASASQDFNNGNGNGNANSARICQHSNPHANVADCNAIVLVDGHGSPQVTTAPKGYGPLQLRGAYGLTGTNSTQTIGIVDAFYDPNLKSDLDVYDQTFGLPVFPSCSAVVTSSCFKTVDQRGTTKFGAVNANWAQETSLDAEVAHAMCPSCQLVVVQTDSNAWTDLMAGEDQAVAQGAKYVSNSFGGAEFASETSFDSHFNVPGVVFTVSAGDEGYEAEYPATSPYVVAVGGTTLSVTNSNTYGGETVWNETSSGCSVYEVQPAFQSALHLTGCANRITADVSADANPSTGVAVYDSLKYQNKSGWLVFGGTSVSSPLIAAVYALANNGGSNATPYAHVSSLHDIISGNDGKCSVAFLCHAEPGYDGPTGIGTPNGLGGF